MTTSSMVGLGYYINEGPRAAGQIIVDRSVEMVTSLSPQPDKNWTVVDGAGHFHAYDQTAGALDHYPTLLTRVEVVPCTDAEHDDDCDGANITHFHCRICDEEVHPGLIPGPHTTALPGRTEWSAKVAVSADEAAALHGTKPVSLRADTSGGHVFGIAHVVGVQISSDDRGTVELVGASPLGRTNAALPALRTTA